MLSKVKRATIAKIKAIPNFNRVFATKIISWEETNWLFISRQKLAMETATVMQLIDPDVPAGTMALEVSTAIGVHPGEYNVSLLTDGARLIASTRSWRIDKELVNGETHSLGAQLLTWPSTWPLQLITDQVLSIVAPLTALTDLYMCTPRHAQPDTLELMASTVGR